MKIKGINPFERNVEKIVLGAVAAIFLVVVALQFVRQPNMITVDNKSVPPGDAYRELEQKAQALSVQIDLQEAPQLPKYNNVDLLTRFRGSLEGDVAPSSRLAWSPPGIELGITGEGAAQIGTRVVEVVPPAPRTPIANVTAAAIHPGDVAEMPALAAVLPATQPYDKEAVTVEAVFDGTALRAALQADPDGDKGVSPMPSNWWQDSTQILGVRLEREELTSTGEWTNTTPVPAMPGREDLIARATGPGTAHKPDLDAIVAEARTAPEAARSPEYYRTIAGPEWVAPHEVAEQQKTGTNKTQIDRLLADKAANAKKVADLEEQRKTATDKPSNKEPAPIGRTPDPGSGGKGQGGGQQGGNTPPAVKQKQPTKKEIDSQIKTTKEKIDHDDQRLKELGYEAPAGVDAATPGAAPKAKALLDDASVRVWAHDLTAQPGKTYRYHMQIAVNNPAYDRAAFIAADQGKFAGTPVLYSAWSEWTGPVALDGMECYFVVGATEGGEGPLGGTRAIAELYKFYYGYWRQGKVNLEPGDLLASTAKLPALFSYDVAKMAQAPTDTSGNAPPPDRGGRPAASQDQTPSGGAAVPPGQTPLERELSIVLDTVLLDVSHVPGGLVPGANRLANGSVPNQALLRDPSGQIVVRIPDLDRASDLYDRVTKSAREGANQGAAVVTPGTGDNNEPPKGGPKPPPGKGDDGKGGGGGGGGG